MKRALSKLRDELLDLQLELRNSKRCAVALIITGTPAAGRSETINELLSWLDPKYVRVHAFGRPDFGERRRPPMWRYWQSLPMRGRMAFYFAGWYADSIADPRRASRPAKAKRALERIQQLESMLVADGVKIVKVHLHVDRKTQRERLKELSTNKLTRWRVTEEDRWFAKHFAQAQRTAQRCLRASNHDAAPWYVVDGSDIKQRVLEVGEKLRDALREAVATSTGKIRSAPRKRAFAIKGVQPEVRAQALADEHYEHTLESLQGRLALMVRRRRFRKHALVLAFEGMDAAGKGGAIRRITQALDARQYQVIPVSAPSQEEAAHPYLWRFWRHVPERGEITIFDRSWYGRVLVERVRSLTPEVDWRRAYDEIAEFERQLTEFGIVVVKFWMSVSQEEQLERFKVREEDPLKRFKVDKEDWENRRHYDAYQTAAAEMIHRTHRDEAPWIVIDANDKKHARLQVLTRVCEEVERGVNP
jgi:polyphosphate:AMP phosphotransferase